VAEPANDLANAIDALNQPLGVRWHFRVEGAMARGP
jgi:hypothetical protein